MIVKCIGTGQAAVQTRKVQPATRLSATVASCAYAVCVYSDTTRNDTQQYAAACAWAYKRPLRLSCSANISSIAISPSPLPLCFPVHRGLETPWRPLQLYQTDRDYSPQPRKHMMKQQQAKATTTATTTPNQRSSLAPHRRRSSRYQVQGWVSKRACLDITFRVRYARLS